MVHQQAMQEEARRGFFAQSVLDNKRLDIAKGSNEKRHAETDDMLKQTDLHSTCVF